MLLLFLFILQFNIIFNCFQPFFDADDSMFRGVSIQIRFIDNTDPAGIDHQIAQLGPELSSTLVLVISKVDVLTREFYYMSMHCSHPVLSLRMCGKQKGWSSFGVRFLCFSATRAVANR